MENKTKFNGEKFSAVVHYIIRNCENKVNVGKTVLFKILYFADFDYYELFEKSITGETYARLPLGPAPRDFDNVVSELKKEGKIKEIDVIANLFNLGTFL